MIENINITITGLRKAGVILHALALSMKDESAKKECLALVGVIAEAVRLIEAVKKGAQRGPNPPPNPPHPQRSH